MPREFMVNRSLNDNPPGVGATGAARSAAAHAQRAHRGLDTHDWRLFRAGLFLEQHRTSRDSWVVLSDLDGGRASRVAIGTGTVSLATLPRGNVKDRVNGLVGVRALMTRATAEGPSSLLAVLDDQDKTVAPVAVRGPLSVDGGDSVGVHVRVEPMRGYRKDARQVAGRLADVSGLVPADGSLFEGVAEARGLVPGRYRSKPDVSLNPDMQAAEAFSITLGQLLEIVRENVDDTLRQLDTEFLHELRVAVRRRRSLLKVAHGVVPEEVLRSYARELEWLADATSLSRDLDVYLLGFDDMVAEADAEAMKPFRVLLEQRQRRAHTALNRVLWSQRFEHLLDGWQRELAGSPADSETARMPIALLSQTLLHKAWRKVEKRGGRIDVESPPEALHDLRKRCKELRYLLEFVGRLYEQHVHNRVVGELKRLQDNLGEFQDAESQRHLVQHYAEDLRAGGAPAQTLLTMGRMEHGLEQRQNAAHAHFGACWKRFDGPQNRRRFRGMVSSV